MWANFLSRLAQGHHTLQQHTNLLILMMSLHKSFLKKMKDVCLLVRCSEISN